MDPGPDETVCGEGPDQSDTTAEMSEPMNTECGSPMQQSPDQSNINDNYRSPENVNQHIEEEYMDTKEDNPDSPDIGIESENTFDDEQRNDIDNIDNIDISVKEAEKTEGQVVESNQPMQKSPECDSSGELDEMIQDNDDLNEGVDEKHSSEVTNNEKSVKEKEDINETESNTVDSVEQESKDGVVTVDPSKTSEDSNDVDQSDGSSNEESYLKGSNLEGNDNDITNSGSHHDVVDKESLGEISQSPGSQEVSSTSFDKDLPTKIDSQSASENLDENNEIPSVPDSDSFKFPGGWTCQTKKLEHLNIDTLGAKGNMSASSSVDNFSTTSLQGSTDSDEDISDFDLTKPDEDIDGCNQDKDKVNDQTSEVEHGFSSSSSVLEKNRLEPGESDLVNREGNIVESENVEGASEESGMQEEKLLQTSEDKKLEDSLEEVSDEEDENIEGDEMTKEEKQQGSLSGMEEVSSDEEGEQEESDDEKDARKAGSGMEEVSEDDEIQGDDTGEKESAVVASETEADKERNVEVESGMEEVSDEEDETGENAIEEEKKVESGMEEVSEEEEESEDENSSGVENVSSDEEGDVLKADDEKVDASRTVEVKQNGETVAIDDTGKEDGAIVKEMLENMTIKIENSGNEEKTEVVDKRRKSKDKKDRRESAKSKTKSNFKDTRDINERLKAQASYGDDVELDYDDTVHDESKDKQVSESEGEITSDSSSSDGEIEEEECEEGEIKEPGQRPYVKPTCRFFMRGHCTWGINCRFLHPGVNDKGNYQLIERPGFNNKPPPPFEEKWEEEEPERSPTPEPPPPPPEPKEETAWERGLRQAKELRKKALERREMETNFEHKKMNLSIEDNPEYDKENVDELIEKPSKKSPVKKTPYYDKYEPLSDDEYYDQTPMRLQQKQMEQSWMSGQYENFEVHWTQDQYGPPQGAYPQQMSRYPYQQDQPMRNRERMPLRPSPRRYSMSPPPAHNQRGQMRPPQREPPEMIRRDKMREQRMSPPPQKQRPGGPGRPKADDWNDPWTRANAAKGKSPKKRSRSRGRRRSRRSHSYSSYSSSSYSGSSRSRSRSSSYSSISSRSSSRSSVSRSRSPVPRRGGMRRPVPGGNQPMRRPSAQGKPNEPPRSSVAVHGRGDRPVDRRTGGIPRSRGASNSPTKGVRGPQPMQGRHPPGRQPPGKQPPSRSLGQQIADVGRGKRPPQKSAQPSSQPQRKFQMAVKSRDRPLPQSALTKDKGKPMSGPGARKRKTSSSSSRSRSRSRSSSSSSRSSYSSRSSLSRSRSRSSSTSSSGSADSDHLYRNIGSNRGNQKAAPSGRPNPGAVKHGRGPPGGRPGQGRPSVKPGETSRPSSLAQAKAVKDPMKMTGLKSNIKLTLIKQSDKPPPGSAPEPVSRKRPAETEGEAPPQKRPAGPSPSKIDKQAKKPEKAAPISPTKAPGRPPGPGKPAPGPSTSPAPGATAAPAAVKKKSTVSRREELLKQLKAVEDAIAKKKKKMG